VGVGLFIDGDVPGASAVSDAELWGYGAFANDGGGPSLSLYITYATRRRIPL
jgi:hypothetical protein